MCGIKKPLLEEISARVWQDSMELVMDEIEKEEYTAWKILIHLTHAFCDNRGTSWCKKHWPGRWSYAAYQ